MSWTATTKTAYPDFYIAITHSSHMPHSKQQTSLMRRLLKSVVEGFLILEFFSGLFLEVLRSLMELSTMKMRLGIWQKCTAVMSYLDTHIERRSERAAQLKKAQDTALVRLLAEAKWTIRSAAERHSDGDKELHTERLAQRTRQSGSSPEESLTKNGGCHYEC